MDGYSHLINPDVLKDYNLSSLIYHRFIESMKHGYAKRTILGDIEVGDPEKIEQIQEVRII